MKRIPQDQIQPRLLSILLAFSDFCQEQGLRYFLCGGTLLGAIRHQGFIPWDDDIDVIMPAESYERLIAIAGEDAYFGPSRRYRILAPGQLPNIYPFIKIVDTTTLVYEKNISHQFATGLWIDVFRLSPLPESDEETDRLIRRQNRLKNINKALVFGDPEDALKPALPFVKAAAAALRVAGWSPTVCAQKIRALEDVGNPSPNRLGNLGWPVGFKDKFDAAWYADTRDVTFEGHTLPGPVGAEAYLVQLYGDYLQLPPEKDRVRHDFDAWEIEG